MQFPMALPSELSGHFKLSFKNKWCRLSELNGWPTDYKSVALPTELSRHTKIVCAVHYNHFKRDYQIMVPRGGIEPPTRGFSILCSTDWAIWANFSFMQNINKDFQCNSRWLYRLSYLGKFQTHLWATNLVVAVWACGVLNGFCPLKSTFFWGF